MAQKARLLLIKRKTGATAYETVAAFKSQDFSLSNSIVDTSEPDYENPGGKLVESSMPGMQSLKFSGEGLADTRAAFKSLDEAAFNQTEETYMVIVPGVASYEGNALIEDFNYSGSEADPLGFKCSFRFSGAITRTEAV